MVLGVLKATQRSVRTSHKSAIKDATFLRYVTVLLCLGQARLLGTLAVSRGLGDHQLKVIDTNIEVKPFLSSIPKVSRSTQALQDGIKRAVLFLCSTHLLQTWQVLAVSFFHPPSLCMLPRESSRQRNLEE